ncbi:MAG: DUF1800 family protein [Verrucomicrobia bacterium]|nr:DUF1800 family protein [Verrucomicrobiota bacterium]
MSHKKLWFSFLAVATGIFSQPHLRADDTPPPAITGNSVNSGQKQILWEPYPAALQYKILRSPTALGPFSEDTSGSVAGNTWKAPLTSASGFYRLQVDSMKPDDLLVAQVLNRLAYGPTPDELERVKSMGAAAFIREQLAPELIQEDLEIDKPSSDTGWQYVTASGYGSSSLLYIYLTEPGDCYVDDVKLVAGTIPEKGANLVRNGGFESALKASDWTVSSNHFGSELVTDIKHSGQSSLHVVAGEGGSTKASAIYQDNLTPNLSSSQLYTLSYWFHPGTNRMNLVVRLSGRGIVGSPDSLFAKLSNGAAILDDLRAWHVLHAIQAKRQLLEVVDQFLENHFVTQVSKSQDYFGNFYPDDATRDRLATQLEFKENQKWRQALLNPACTFYDLLKISAESPAMIVYLDTAGSRGDGSNIANENYARELLELFTFGVDNGYDQNDITVMSRAWTGWTLELLDPGNEGNPFAVKSTTLKPGVTSNPKGSYTNLVGVWSFRYRSDHHNNKQKILFPGKTVPARFGAPYAGRSYELVLPARTGTNGIQDGYEVIRHLAGQPFTQEFISVKLCRLFVHDDFAIGYDFTDPNLSAEGQLVKQCMQAWENSSPKGQIRQVLATIFNSDLFRSHGGVSQKVKTPLEFTASAIRALRAANPDGTYTASTDGYALNGQNAALDRMGGMNLFDRAEPDGYPEAAAPWVSAGTLDERLRFVQSYLTAVNQRNLAGQRAENDAGNVVADPVALVKLKLPATDWNKSSVVADYFLSLVFPGEGKANLDTYRSILINYLDTANDGNSASPFSSLAMTGNPSPYDVRLRGMVAALLTFQRFQEQ